MKQEYLIGDKVRLNVTGTIKEVYVGWDSKKREDVIRYKFINANDTILVMGITAEDITREEL